MLPLCLTVASMASLFLWARSCTRTSIYPCIHCTFNSVQLLKVSSIYYFSVEAFVCLNLWSRVSKYKYSLKLCTQMAGGRNSLCKYALCPYLKNQGKSHSSGQALSSVYKTVGSREASYHCTEQLCMGWERPQRGSVPCWCGTAVIWWGWTDTWQGKKVTQPFLVLVFFPEEG